MAQAERGARCTARSRLRVDDVAVGDARGAEPRALGHARHGRVAALLVVVVGAHEPIAQQDLVTLDRFATAARHAVRVGLRVLRLGFGFGLGLGLRVRIRNAAGLRGGLG